MRVSRILQPRADQPNSGEAMSQSAISTSAHSRRALIPWSLLLRMLMCSLYQSAARHFLSAEKAKYTVRYDLNGGTGEIADDDTYTAFEGENNIVAVTYKVPTLDGKIFDHWELAGDNSGVYRQYSRFTINASTVRYANNKNEFVFKAVWADIGKSSRHIGLQQQVHDGDEARDDDDEHRQADVVRDDLGPHVDAERKLSLGVALIIVSAAP